jgi:ferredoxin
MEVLGGRAIPVGCRGGGCGICKIEVLSGRYRTARMSRSRISADEEARGMALACRLYPEDDLTIRVVGKIAKFIQPEGVSPQPRLDAQ